MLTSHVGGKSRSFGLSNLVRGDGIRKLHGQLMEQLVLSGGGEKLIDIFTLSLIFVPNSAKKNIMLCGCV